MHKIAQNFTYNAQHTHYLGSTQRRAYNAPQTFYLARGVNPLSRTISLHNFGLWQLVSLLQPLMYFAFRTFPRC